MAYPRRIGSGAEQLLVPLNLGSTKNEQLTESQTHLETIMTHAFIDYELTHGWDDEDVAALDQAPANKTDE